MTKIQLDYYLQAAAVPPGLGQLQCFFLLNLDRISVGFLLKTVPGYSWASACATVRRTSSYQEYLFSSSRPGEITPSPGSKRSKCVVIKLLKTQANTSDENIQYI